MVTWPPGTRLPQWNGSDDHHMSWHVSNRVCPHSSAAKTTYSCRGRCQWLSETQNKLAIEHMLEHGETANLVTWLGMIAHGDAGREQLASCQRCYVHKYNERKKDWEGKGRQSKINSNGFKNTCRLTSFFPCFLSSELFLRRGQEMTTVRHSDTTIDKENVERCKSYICVAIACAESQEVGN